MRLLAIETSCDETAISILDCEGDERSARFEVRGNALLTQVVHKEYGGVYPALAKREHAKNLVPLLEAALAEAELLHESTQDIDAVREPVAKLLERETGLSEALLAFVGEAEVPEIDAIAVTKGPGLEPALWVGINFAQALSLVWRKPLVGVNHMEGHLLASLAQKDNGSLVIENVELPALALLISGGHTELVLMNPWLSYKLIGATRDDAAGEAFDKVARMMDLPYPGGPEISKLAERDREDARTSPFSLPRPMIDSDDFDFSFSGLKTAVLYAIKEKGSLTDIEKEQLARAFEDAVADVLTAKTLKAVEATGAQTVTVGGGVSANVHIRRALAERLADASPSVTLAIPAQDLTTDNAVMIGMAGFYRLLKGETTTQLRADGNLALTASS